MRNLLMTIPMLLICNQSAAQTIHVDGANGDDGNDGSAADRAVQTVQRGADIVKGGDVLIIHSGTYYEQPSFENLDSSESQPVWVVGLPRGNVTIHGGWARSHQGQVNWSRQSDGSWSASNSYDPLIGWHGTTALLRLQNRQDLERSGAQTRAHFVNVPVGGFTYENGNVYLRLPNDADPNGESVGFSTPPYFRSGSRDLVTVQNSPHVIFDRLMFEGSGQSCIGFDRGSHHATIRNVAFRYCTIGATLGDDSIIEWTEYGSPGLKEYALETQRLNGGRIGVYELVIVVVPREQPKRESRRSVKRRTTNLIAISVSFISG